MESCRGIVKDGIDEDFYIRETENCCLRFVEMVERGVNDDLEDLEWGLSARGSDTKESLHRQFDPEG